MSTKEKTARGPVKTKKKTEKEAPRPLQDVVYMPPKPFMRNRLLLRLATVVAIVVALVLCMAVFFRVEHIQVSGMEQYSAWDISQASGIKQGDSLFSLGLPGAAAKIKALNYVKDVRIGIKLPNIVMIEITEVRVTYAVKADNDEWWLVDSRGRVIEKATEEDSYLTARRMAREESPRDFAFRPSCKCGKVEKGTVDYKNGTAKTGFTSKGRTY